MSVSIAYILMGLPFLLAEHLNLRLKKEQEDIYKIMFIIGSFSIPFRIMSDSIIFSGFITVVQTIIIGISAFRLLNILIISGKKKD